MQRTWIAAGLTLLAVLLTAGCEEARSRGTPYGLHFSRHHGVGWASENPAYKYLHWKCDSEDVQGYAIYSSKSPIDPANLGTAARTLVPFAVPSFPVYLPENYGVRYFRVEALGVGQNGQVVRIGDLSDQLEIDTTSRILYGAGTVKPADNSESFDLQSYKPRNGQAVAPLSWRWNEASGKVARATCRHVFFDWAGRYEILETLRLRPDGIKEYRLMLHTVADGTIRELAYKKNLPLIASEDLAEWSSDGQWFAYVPWSSRSSLHVIPLFEEGASPTNVVGFVPRPADGPIVRIENFAWAPDGRKLAFAATVRQQAPFVFDHSELFAVGVTDGVNPPAVLGYQATQHARQPWAEGLLKGEDTIGQRNRPRATEDVRRFAWSPDSTRIAYAYDAAGDDLGGEVWVHRYAQAIDANNPVSISDGVMDWGFRGLSFDAFGRWVAWADFYHIHTNSPQGGGRPETVFQVVNSRGPDIITDWAWAPKRGHIAVTVTYVDGVPRPILFTADAENPDPWRITVASGQFFLSEMTGSFRWSPDGQSIAFTSGYFASLYIADRAGLRQTLISGGSGEFVGAATENKPKVEGFADDWDWSPDGKTLAWFGAEPGEGGMVRTALFRYEAASGRAFRVGDALVRRQYEEEHVGKLRFARIGWDQR